MSAPQVVRHRIPRLMPPQREFVQWEPPGGLANCEFSEAAILSPAFGTGKTMAAAARFARVTMQYGRRDAYALITAPIARTLESTIPAQLEKFYPPGFIRTRRRPHGTLEWVLQNGQRVAFWSGKSFVDSIDCWLIWPDEAQHPEYRDQVKWDRLLGRLRGASPYFHLIASGIAVDDEDFRSRWDKPDNPNSFVVLPGLEQSWNGINRPGYIERAVARKEKRVAEAIRKGGWVPPAEGAFPDLDLSLGGNVVDADLDPYFDGDKPVLLGLDPGEQYGVVIAVPWKASDGSDALLFIQSMVFDHYSSEQVMDWLKRETSFRFERIYVDTDAQRDVRVLIQQQAPDATIEGIHRATKQKGTTYRLEKKLERFRWAICDGTNVRRLLLHKRMLTEGRRCLVDQLRRAKVKDNGKLSKPDSEHTRDAAMYVVMLYLKEKPAREEVDYTDASYSVEGAW